MTKTVELSSAFVRVTERGAIAAARTMGQGDRKYSSQVSVEAIRRELDTVDVEGTIVIGEGERDQAPMLYIGEKVGGGGLAVDIAVDPLEGTSMCATGAAHSISVLAAAERGGLFGVPDIYMEKLVVGPSSKGKVDINASVEDNLKAIAAALDLRVTDLVVAVLDRPRHERLVADIRKAGARIRLIPDGDLSASIAAAVVGTGVHALMGVGGAPEGVLAAAAMRCLNGEIQARLVLTKPADGERLRQLGIDDMGRVYGTSDLCPAKSVILSATGVTDGALLKGVRFFGDGMRSHTVVMTTVPHQVRFIDTIHAANDPHVRIRF